MIDVRVALLGFACLVWTATAAPAAEAAVEIAAPEAHALSQADRLTIIDVRRPGEWRETGFPEDAVGVSLHNAVFMVRGDFVSDVLAAVDGDRAAPIALICAGGVRSAAALDLLAQAGFTNLHDINEGMMGNGRDPGWLARGLPRRPCPDC